MIVSLAIVAATLVTATPLSELPFQRWSPLPGKVVGLLVADPGPWGWTIGWAYGSGPINESGSPIFGTGLGGKREPDPRYVFYFAGGSAQALYFLSDGEGVNFLAQPHNPLWGANSAAGIAMLAPGIRNRFGLDGPAHFVRLEVNGGQGAKSDVHFIATSVEVLDGKGGHPDPGPIFEQAHALHLREVTMRGQQIENALSDAWSKAIASPYPEPCAGDHPPPPVNAQVGPKPFGPFTRKVTEGFFPSWHERDGKLTVRYVRRITTEATRKTFGYLCPAHCPPGAPCRPSPFGWMELPDRRSAGVEVGTELTFNREGTLTARRVLPPVRIDPSRNE